MPMNTGTLAANMNDSPISSIEEILEDARNGKPYILVDAEDRENEGDVIIPAQFATPDQINFMARHARGLICLAVTAERARQLRLPPMTAENRESMGTAFTVSIEAKEGVTTGISAADRSRTIQVATDPTRGPDDIVSPGHIFPLVARDGGVLVRTGHPEAAPVDLVVIGLPVRTTGHEGPEAARIRETAALISERVAPVPVEFMDERFTTTRAHQIMFEGNMDSRKRRNKVDKVAAAIFLQDFLDRRREERQ